MIYLDSSALIKRCEAFTRIEVRAELIKSAKVLAVTHGLRTLEAVHLATALEFKHRIGGPMFFVAADRRLLSSAVAAGLQTINVESPGDQLPSEE